MPLKTCCMPHIMYSAHVWSLRHTSPEILPQHILANVGLSCLCASTFCHFLTLLSGAGAPVQHSSASHPSDVPCPSFTDRVSVCANESKKRECVHCLFVSLTYIRKKLVLGSELRAVSISVCCRFRIQVEVKQICENKSCCEDLLA